jgi:hypothetical protein
MARKTVSLFEARSILDRLQRHKEHLHSVLYLVEKDMAASIGDSMPAYPETKEADVVVKEGGEATINVGEGSREPLTPEQLTAYRAKIEPIKQEMEDLCTTIVGVQMALERAELDTQIRIDV